MDQHELTLGLPHTNYRGLAEHLLMMHAGHFQWASLARATGRPLSELRTIAGGRVYATFYFIEERIPDRAPLELFGLDDRLRFAVWLRAFKGLAVEGQILFDHDERLRRSIDGREDHCPDSLKVVHPFIRFANIFITPETGNSRLRVAPPANADFSNLAVLPADENPYHLTTQAEASGSLGLLDDWERADDGASATCADAINPDRDTNGAGLVYFANYLAFMDSAERHALGCCAGRRRFTPEEIDARSVRQRRVAYYGNVGINDTVTTEVSLFVHKDRPHALGCRYVIRRAEDDAVICRSEAIKVLLA